MEKTAQLIQGTPFEHKFALLSIRLLPRTVITPLSVSSTFSPSTHAHYKPVENCVKIEHDANRSTFQLRSRSEAHFCAHAVNVGNVRPPHLRVRSRCVPPPASFGFTGVRREGGRRVSPLHAGFCGGFSPPTLVRDPGSRDCRAESVILTKCVVYLRLRCENILDISNVNSTESVYIYNIY